MTCPACGAENPNGAKFCSECGHALAAAPAPTREERKVVTCLFCDLVGFTARAERMDPEDVRRLLQPYHARLRSELERFGGTVEKFIGDAVMAVFGAPIAHEDDPERAVRAALAIRDTLGEQGDLEVRVGITTGEALIALGARPEVGEGMVSGDVVNTAARLQTAAATGSILVDEMTLRATERAVEYGESRLIEAKGKAEPVAVWEALRARSRVGVERTGGAPLVGREQELALLRETFPRLTREREPQLVTLVGVPGIGKSRLVFELYQTIDSSDYGLIYWRLGRSLPYGEGVTFWALAEMVKAQAGILESDGPEQADERLRVAVNAVVADPTEAAWIERYLRPLAGLEVGEGWADDRRSEAFAAWRRFLEALAEERPLVLVFEDLHWADDVLLDFVEYLLDWVSGVPLLALCTARPELVVRRPGWGGGKLNSSTILLSPLSEEETTTLVHALLGRSAIDADLQSRLLEHAGGNPLYAEEFTRMLAARPGETLLPETVQGIIAARLDTLPTEEKELLQTAAVVGRTFWLGALGQARWTLEERLHSLEQKEFVARNRRSSVAGEDEYTFRHGLVRDVAYEQIPKGDRAEKHQAAAEWIESLGRPDSHAEMLAHHYAAALEFARAAGQDERPHAERARHALRLAGDRSFSLNAFSQAADYYGRALELWPEDGRGELLLRYGHVLHIEQNPRRIEVLEEAAVLLDAGKRERAAEAHALLTDACWHAGQVDKAFAHLERAVQLVAEAPASAEKVRVLTEASRTLAVSGDAARALTMAEEAYATAETLDLKELAARALSTVAVAKMNLGYRSGILADSDRSLELALSVNSPEAARALHNKGAILFAFGDVSGSGTFFKQAAEQADRLGNAVFGRYSRGTLGWNRYSAGAWDEALEFADAFIAECESSSPSYVEFEARLARARIGVARGSSEEVVDHDLRRALEVARVAKDAQAMVPSLSNAARVYVDLDRLEGAWEIREELAPLLEAGVFQPHQVWQVFDLVWVAQTLRLAAPVGKALAQANPEDPWRQAAEAVLACDFAAAATTLATMGHVDEAYARLRAAEKLVAEGRAADADEHLQRSLAFWRSVGATRYIREGEALLAKTA